MLNNDSSKIIDRDTLVAMNESLFHRGPDDQGYFIRGNVGLGMRRLSIIDIKGGNQPIYNENKTICVVCNGEIYNYIELRNELEGKGHRFSTNTDVEVIAHLYEEYGQDLVQKLRGMFAFALYDLSAKKLILGRDRLGIKPLYYSFQKGILLFASELKAILRYPGLERKLSYEALSDYLTYLYIPSPETIYENIYKLPPAHLLVFKNKDFALNQYWEIDYRKQKEQREEYYLENFNDLLRETIKMHLMSEVPLGAFLSGGVDSSSIVALMAEVMDSPVKTFSVGFDVSDFNELKYAKLLANRFNTEHHEINLMPDIINILPKLVSYFDEPFADSSAIPTYLVSEFAKKRVTVCLAGDGGDELFAGYGWTRRQKFIDDYNCLPRVIRRFTGSVFLGSNYVIDYKGSLPEKMKRFFYDADMPLVESFMRRRTCFSETMKKGLFNENINRRLSNYRSISKISPYFERNK
ncbi:MAG: asparagine synthase (glutamine-hydrolyzing), partial [Candidatus Omnitrophica bacterium]|nr:asparagine synthase (glutamine-hydrolyzing) [Candidatus Omnitrophota bacterium]